MQHGIAMSAAGAALAGALVASSASAQTASTSTYPERLIKIVVPFPAGGPTDVAARLVVDQLAARLKQSVVVENQAGAGGRTGSKMVAKAAPDGYLLLIGGTNMNAVVPAIYAKLDYDPIKDFAPVAAIATDPMVLAVWPGMAARTVADLVAHAKANPGQVSAGAVVGISQHFATELFKVKTGANITFVPYKGGAPAIQDVLGGHIQVIFNNKSTMLALIQADKLRPLAVTSPTRWSELPAVPTLAEGGLTGFPSNNSYGVLAPAGTPPAVIARLNGTINDILRSPEAQASFAKLGVDASIGSAEDFGAALAVQAREWDTIVKETGIKIE